MCTGIVRGAICEAIEDRCLSLDSPRILIMKERGRELLQKQLENEQTMQTFDEFSATLCSKFEKLFEASKTLKSHSTMRGRLWSAFHKVSTYDLPPIWERLYSSLGTECNDTLICQSTNQILFNMLLTKHFSQIPTENTTSNVDTVLCPVEIV